MLTHTHTIITCVHCSLQPNIKYWCYCGQWLSEPHGLSKELQALTYDPRNSLVRK